MFSLARTPVKPDADGISLAAWDESKLSSARVAPRFGVHQGSLWDVLLWDRNDRGGPAVEFSVCSPLVAKHSTVPLGAVGLDPTASWT